MQLSTKTLLQLGKSLMLIIFIQTVLPNSIFAQSGWQPLSSGTTETLSGIFFTNANTGYATGYNGTALKTTDAGVNWFPLSVPTTTEILRFVQFTDINTGYIASGEFNNLFYGNVYKTTNAGINWNALALPEQRHFYSVFFINSSTGYVSGNEAILKTTDAGNSWSQQEFPGYGLITSIYFVNSNVGYACSYVSKLILKTVNAGNNWQTIYTNAANAGYFGICFVDENTGIAVGGNITTTTDAFIQRTTNGGTNWDNCVFNNNNMDYFWSVKFLNSSTGFAAGGSLTFGSVLKTTNAGMNWYFQNVNAPSRLHRFFFTDANTGYVTGRLGTIFKTTDAGGTISGIDPNEGEIPNSCILEQNYPNPFNPSTTISFSLPAAGNVKLIVYDLLGREIAVLINEKIESGHHDINWDAAGYPSGVYFYKLVTQGSTQTKKMILIK